MNNFFLKLIVFISLFATLSAVSIAQTQIIINEFSQGPPATTSDWIELVVTEDNTDIRGVYYDDDNTPGISNVVSNGKNWTDSDGDGLADNWVLQNGNGLASIVTGNGFGGNAQRVDANITANTYIYQSISLVVGIEYKVTFSYRSNNGVQPYIWDGVTAHTIAPLTNTGNSLEAIFTFTATGTAGEIRFYVRSSSGNALAGDYIEVDRVSVRGLGDLGEEYSVQLKKDLADFQSVNKGSIIVIYRLPKDPHLPGDDTNFSDGKIVIPETNTTFLEAGGNGLLLKKTNDQFGIFWDNGDLVDVVGIHGIAWGGITGSASLFSTGWGYTEINSVGAGESAYFKEGTPGDVDARPVSNSGETILFDPIKNAGEYNSDAPTVALNWAIQAYNLATPGNLNGGNNNALPVELTSFAATLIENAVKLNWMTATEVNNYGFYVERKLNDTDWNALGFVEGNGNSNSPKEYSFIDNTVSNAGTYYYRLKQIDNDGTYEYSTSIFVDFDSPVKFDLEQNYPNPFNPSTTIRFNLPDNEFVSLKIFNTLGEEVHTLFEGNLESGIHAYNFNADGLPSGFYIYQLSSANYVQSKKMLLLK